ASGIGDTEYGIAQFTFPVTKGRAYRIEWRLPFCYVSEAVGEVWQLIIYKINGTPTPSDHREAGIRLFSGY
ncbi:hypothetical protein, partial [Salmonella enterica]|uniref:hypothetical protein n=1 Tax=Salmonella enterica TaxID=28901 RepID=UPI0032975F88